MNILTIDRAYSELAHEGHSGADYKRWFGAPSEHRLATVASHFEALTANNFTGYTYVCNTDYCARQPGVYAYVYPDQYVSHPFIRALWILTIST